MKPRGFWFSDPKVWAIVTGASSGIGKALAFEFAAAGFNLFLTGRNENVLAEVASECSRKFRIETQVVAADLSKLEGMDAVIAALQTTPHRYEVLVNNAGFGIHGDFASTDIDLELQLVQVQVAATLKLTKAVLPAMISRRSGRILNVASVYSFAPVPFQSVYSASKAFLLSLSSSLQNELDGTGVTVTVFCPGITQTEFRSRAGIAEKHKNSGMTAEATARIAYLATMSRKHIVIPGFLNRLFVIASRMIPATVFARVVKSINRIRGQQK